MLAIGVGVTLGSELGGLPQVSVRFRLGIRIAIRDSRVRVKILG